MRSRVCSIIRRYGTVMRARARACVCVCVCVWFMCAFAGVFDNSAVWNSDAYVCVCVCVCVVYVCVRGCVR